MSGLVAVTPPIPLIGLAPELILAGGGCIAMLVGQARRETVARLAPAVTLLTLLVAIGAFWLWQRAATFSGNGLMYADLAAYGRVGTLVLGVVLTLVAWHQAQRGEHGEFYAMMLFSLTGLMMVGACNDLLMLFLVLELVSIPTYVLVTLSRRRLEALEAGTKYFYLGAMAAAITAYGFSFLYGVAGSCDLDVVAHRVRAALTLEPGRSPSLQYGLAVAGLVLSIGGLLFKLAAFPLHFYIADVYQGAASSVAGLLGFVPKFAGVLAIALILRCSPLWDVEPGAGHASAVAGLFWFVWIIAALSMTIGNVLALMQTNLKRMLAYSGIAHSGYMLVGLLAGPNHGESFYGDGTAGVFYYAVIYGIANLGAFAVLGMLRVEGEACETLRDVAGLLRRHPGLALLMALVMFTLLGLPPLPGFWGKFSLFGGALVAAQSEGLAEAGLSGWLITLVVIALLNSAIGAAYYLRVVAAVLLYENDRPAEATPREALNMGAMLCGFLLLIFTIFPAALMLPGRSATATLRAEAPDGAPAALAARAEPTPSAATRTEPRP